MTLPVLIGPNEKELLVMYIGLEVARQENKTTQSLSLDDFNRKCTENAMQKLQADIAAIKYYHEKTSSTESVCAWMLWLHKVAPAGAK